MHTSGVANTMNRASQNRQPFNRLLVGGGRVLLYSLFILLVLAGSGAIYQVIATARDMRAFPPPGQLVDVGGYKLHLVCTGPQNAAAPTVILAHVGDGNVAQWGLVQPEIAKTTRVCAYDRAGFGWSERGPAPRDGRQSMSELHTLLTNARIAAPYILVGHSYGGNVARLYVAAYPQEVAGLVLVDPGQLFDTPGVPVAINAAWQADGQTVMRLAPYLSRLGLLRLLAALGVMPGHGDLPPVSGAAYDAVNLTTKFWDTLSDQNAAMATTSQQVLGAPHHRSDLPVVVLSAALPDDESRRVWTAVNAALATHSTNGIHRVVDGATHMGLALHQEHAQATIAAILQVVEAARTGLPLP
ncbi:MAG: alpha/beta hydrolase [Caldilinea sp. CFX5]|nr:alpha/beta hydrolase [Caldilinea sp. CFX5]